MKVLAVALALAIFAGSPASVFSEEEPVSRLDLLRENIRNYYRDLIRPFEDQAALIRQTKVFNVVRGKASKSFWNVTRRFQRLHEELPRNLQEALGTALVISGGLAEKLYRPIQDAAQRHSERMEPAARELYSAVESAVAPRAEQALEVVRPYTDMLRARMQEIGRNQTERLKSSLQELEALGPQIKSALKQLQEVQVSLQPLADEVQEQVRRKLVDVLQPYAPGFMQAAEEFSTKVQKWFARKR